MNRMSEERETVVELPFAAGCCPCVERLRTVLPVTVGTRDGAVQLVSTFGSVVTSARSELGSNLYQSPSCGTEPGATASASQRRSHARVALASG
jgi:hypothetical protein